MTLHVFSVATALALLTGGVGVQVTTPTASTVLQRLTGNWKLLKFVNLDESGAERDAGYEGGRIMYDAAGNMAAQLMRRTRDNYVAYYGRVTVDPTTSKVTHHVEGASIANWVGTDLVRYYEFTADGNLLLSIRNAQGRVTGTLTWGRVGPSAH